MMTIKSFSKTDHSLTVVVMDGGSNQVLRTNDSNPRWNDVLSALSRNDATTLVDLCNIGRSIERFTDGSMEIKDGNVFYKGRQLFGLDVTRLLEYMRDNIPYLRLERFLVRKQANPSYRSINELYKFLEHREMTLTERGTIIGYKGVRDDYFSIMGNTSTVVTSGTVNSGGHILNEVGEKVRCDRSCVCDDYQQGCSPGLHIGSLAYAKSWGPRVMIVEFDPADVVSVPDDCECQKLRACAYEVIGEFKGEVLREVAEVTPENENADNVVDDEDCPTIDDNSDMYEEAYDAGLKDGKAHKVRKHYVTDLDDDNLSEKELVYIKGYNTGYRRGRYGK
jgi:hypothetical protein